MMRRLRGYRWIVVVPALVLAACSSRLSMPEWEAEWNGVTGAIPLLDTVLNADQATRSLLCSETLGHLRSAVELVERAPDADIEHAALTYLEFSESVFFECPLTKGEHAGFEAGYLEMDRLASVIETLIAYDD